MYKRRLNELCQQRQWAPPRYTCAQDGPAHNLRFRASVSVNGVAFHGPQDAPSRTSKDAQNEAARLAFAHLAAPSPATTHSPQLAADTMTSGSSSAKIEVDDNPARNKVLNGHGSGVNGLTMDAREMQYSYKSQLQCFTQMRNLSLPTYDHVREGSPHVPRFKAFVTIDGQLFESSQFFGKLKDAEHAAAKVALMSLSTVENEEEENAFYKKLLQELTQKEGLTLPAYNTVIMPTFYSTVEIEGERFEGSAAKTKRQAEINAAKVAWTRLREHDEGPHVTEQVGGSCIANSSVCLLMPNSTEKKGQSPSMSSSDAVYTQLRDPFLEDQFPEECMLFDNGMPSTSSVTEGSASSSTDGASVCPAGNGDGMVIGNRVLVYPRRSDLQLPPGTKMLPFSDEVWVAVIVEPSSDCKGSIPV